MRKTLIHIIVLCIIVLFVGCSVKSNVYTGEYYEKEGKYYYISNNKPITGTIFKYHPNGGLHYELELKKGLKNGREAHYFTTGNIIDLKEYKKGILNGKSIEAHIISQRVVKRGEYLKGKKTGIWRLYYDNGMLKEEINYKNNKKISSIKYDIMGNQI